jgi:hypothetical protein
MRLSMVKNLMRGRFRVSCALALFGWFCAAAAGANGGATLTVTNTNDDGTGSLRAVIAAAADGDTIQFDGTLNGQTITLTSGELVIDKDITVTGPGPDLLTVAKTPSQPPYFRIFHIRPDRIVVIAGLTISGGYASGELAGGIWNQDGTLTISNCKVSGNFSDGGAGGGGIYNGHKTGGTLTIVDSVVSDNWSGFTFGNPIGYGGGIINGGTLTIIRSTISDNIAYFYGGGIYGGGTITIIDSTISGNRSGLDAFEFSGLGGGILKGSVGGALVISNSTISGNTASGGNGTGAGGGIFGDGVVMITNSTVSGNFANRDGGGFSGGESGTTLTITNSTFSDNQANRNGGGIHHPNGGTFEIKNTIMKAGVSGANIFNNGGTVTSLGYNLSSDSGGGFLTASGDQINTDPILGPLQNNGGPTFTHIPLTGSPAINAGDPNFTPPPLYDQRGYVRVANGRIDIGSVEAQSAPPPPSPTATATPTPTATATPTGTPSATASPTGTPTPTHTATPTASPTPSSSPARALNISTRLRVETGNGVMIGGFIVYGGASKIVAVRGIGPSLTGVGISGALADPTLELRAANGTLLFQNDNWQDDSAQAAQLTSLGLAPQNSNESGLVATLQPGAYTAVLAGKNGGTGVGLVEIYDTDFTSGRLSVAAPTGQSSRLANISTRGFVQTGDNVMIGGFILGGSTASTAIAVRGIGPSLTQSGLSNVLADPILELRDNNGALLSSNDNWQDDQVSAAQLRGHALAPQDPLESGIFTSLPPGAFTAILAGKNSGVGLGLVEIYNVQ